MTDQPTPTGTQRISAAYDATARKRSQRQADDATDHHDDPHDDQQPTGVQRVAAAYADSNRKDAS